MGAAPVCARRNCSNRPSPFPPRRLGASTSTETSTRWKRAYLFHLVKNHPFVDGNKRTGLMVMLVFLGLNGLSLQAGEDELVELVLGVAEGRVGKAEVAVFAKGRTRPR